MSLLLSEQPDSSAFYLFPPPCPLLIESTFFQVVLNDNISNSIKHKLHILGISGTCEVGINFLGVFSSVQILKLTLNVCSCLFVRIRAWNIKIPYFSYMLAVESLYLKNVQLHFCLKDKAWL